MKTLKFIWATSLCVALSMGIISCGHEHEYVDLGLSVKWATCNMGASSPEEYGDHYAWGETETESTYDWNTYKWCKGSKNTLTKYCTDSDYGTVDNKTVLDPEDDVAQVKWGGNWRMPTDAEIEELRENCISRHIFFSFFFARKEIMCIFVPSFGTFCPFRGGGWIPERPRERSALSSFLSKSPISNPKDECQSNAHLYVRMHTAPRRLQLHIRRGEVGSNSFQFWCLAIPVTR